MKKSITKYIIPIIMFVIVTVLYKWYSEKQNRLELSDNYKQIKNYLLNNTDLENNSKPILWIHLPYEYNCRNWQSFGSRSSTNLNQPYLLLTIKSIIYNCDKSFKICLIDDNSYSKLIPDWKVDMKTISSPILDNMRQLGLMKLIYIYGGLICPISFLCMKNLIGMYEKGTQNNKMFMCENNDKNITSTKYQFYPDMSFLGSNKDNKMIKRIIQNIEYVNLTDNTSQSIFLGNNSRFCHENIKNNNIILINGKEIGIKTKYDMPIKVEDLMSQKSIDLCHKTYGIYIPSDDILKRRRYEWFSRLSEKQVLESDTIIGKYLLLSTTQIEQPAILKPLEIKPAWLGFWKTPLVTLYGLKPNFLGDNLQHDKNPIY
jgi:hypothetical protein